MRRHSNVLVSRDRILCPPQTRHSFPLGVKVNAALPIEVARPTASHTLLVTGKTEHRQWYWNWSVDAQLACFDFFLESRRCGTRSSEDCSAIAIRVCVDERNGFVGRVHVEADEDRAKNLFRVAFHMRFHICDYRWPDLMKHLVYGYYQAWSFRYEKCNLPNYHSDTSPA